LSQIQGQIKVNLCVNLIRFIRSFHPFISLAPFCYVSKVLPEPSTFTYSFTFLHIPLVRLEPSNWRNNTCCLTQPYLLPFRLSHVSMSYFLFHLEYSPSRIFHVLYIYIGLILLNKQLVSDWVTSFAGSLANFPYPQIYQKTVEGVQPPMQTLSYLLFAQKWVLLSDPSDFGSQKLSNGKLETILKFFLW